MEFNILNREDFDKASEPNDEVKMVRHHPTPYFFYYTIDNFLKTPHKFIEYLQQYPAHSDYDYGGRQHFTCNTIPELVNAWNKIAKSFGYRLSPKYWITSSNIFWQDMPVKNSFNYPHSDFECVAMISLSDTKGGTAFYNFHGVPHVDLFTEEESIIHSEEKRSQGFKPWTNFDGNEDWELYHIAKTKFNRLVIYDARFFHSPHPEFNDDGSYATYGTKGCEEYKDTRYNLVGFYQNFEGQDLNHFIPIKGLTRLKK